MRRYSVNGQQNVSSPADSILGITSTTAVRPAIVYINVGSSDTPGDVALTWTAQRYTAAGTATAFTPVALDPGDPASTTTAGTNHTVEPTYTASAVVWYLALNTRSSHSWYAEPGKGLKCPATANNGIGLAPLHASSTVLTDSCIHFDE